MKIRNRKFESISGIEFLLLREKLGFQRYRKTRGRDPEKKRILLDLAIKRMEERERNDFIPLGYRRRKLRMPL